MHRLSLLLAIALAAGPALAQDHPLLTPSRDVTVDYTTTGGPGGNQTRNLRIYMAANDAKLRVESASMPGTLIIDRGGKQMMMLMSQQHIYLEMPMNPKQANMFSMQNTSGFTRRGTDRVAGLKCTVWVAKDGGNTGCITADGVLLRGETTTPQGQHATLVATAVTFGKLPAQTFTPPADFKKMNLPASARPGAPPH